MRALLKTALTTALTAALALALLLPTAARAQPSAAAAPDLLLGLLADYEQPVTPEWAELLSDLEGAGSLLDRLEELARDPSQRRYVRVRATGMLPFFPSPRTRELLRELSLTADDAQVRVQAVVALGHGFWAVDREATSAWLTTLGGHPDLRVSAAAIRTLDRLQAAPR